MEEIFNVFLAEANELLVDMESALLKIDEGKGDVETLNQLFRAVHTIKGSAGLFGLDNIVEFTHKLENVLDQARDNKITIDKNLLSIQLDSCDHIKSLVTAIEVGSEIPAELETRSAEIVTRLQPWLNDSGSEVEKETVATASTSQPVGTWHISLKMAEDALINGMEPLAIIRFLEDLGEITYLAVVDDLIPNEDFNPEYLYLGFEIGLNSNASKNEISDAFLFIQEDADITIIPPGSAIDKTLELIRDYKAGSERIGEILLNCGAISKKELALALNKQHDGMTQGEKVPLGEILVADKSTQASVVEAAVKVQTENRNKKSQTIRIEADRLDELITLIGELVICHQRVDQASKSEERVQLEEGLSDMAQLTEKVRDAALVLRMVPIGETFARYRRVVRDVSTELGKDIELILEGEDTELDRSMIEKLVDPLTHIVRNAVDHGIEDPQTRINTGKSPRGTLKLSAFHDAGNIVISIEDDGAGLNPEKIYQKALAAGIIESNREFSKHDIYKLIFHPGFSTKEQVTNLSGRGVGMDVVKRNVESLQGSIHIESEQGRGTQLTLTLPLTLAIIDGFHVKINGADFIVPHAAVVECLDFDEARQAGVGENINLRGELVPYTHLSKVFALEEGKSSQHNQLVVVKFGEKQAGIVVDDLKGELQSVIKPLNPMFRKVKGIGGLSLLGNGEIAFILDIPQLMEFIVNKESRSTFSPEAVK